MDNFLLESMFEYIGQTVTVFTTSGGLSGDGFTGVLISVDCNCVRLLTGIGAPPACPVGSACGSIGCGNEGWDYGYNPFGAVCVIPFCAIACFTHNAI
ncbi:MAG: hypothetical protein LBT44_04390 [Clostridiales bacterium]|jgi:hypothetical protein|nr:hypothetical protein [Clostridiales bacterium]